MSHSERLRRSPNAFRLLTGITPAVFARPTANFTPCHATEAETAPDNLAGRTKRAMMSGSGCEQVGVDHQSPVRFRGREPGQLDV